MNPIEHRIEKKPNLLIYHIERRLIDQSNIQSLLPASQDSIPRSIKHLSERNHISSFTLGDNLVFPRSEFIIAFKEPGFSIFLQNPGHLRTGRKDKPESTFEKDMLNNGRHLSCIGREVEEGLHVGKAIVGIQVVYTCAAISVGRWLIGQLQKPTKMTSIVSLYMPLI
jgi:hypothetical protein